MIDLYNGEVTYTWEDEELVFVTSILNGVTLSMPRLDFLKFVSELNKAAAKVAELQKEEFEKKPK